MDECDEDVLKVCVPMIPQTEAGFKAQNGNGYSSNQERARLRQKLSAGLPLPEQIPAEREGRV